MKIIYKLRKGFFSYTCFQIHNHFYFMLIGKLEYILHKHEYNDRMSLGNILLRLYDYALWKKYPDYKEHPISVRQNLFFLKNHEM